MLTYDGKPFFACQSSVRRILGVNFELISCLELLYHASLSLGVHAKRAYAM